MIVQMYMCNLNYFAFSFGVHIIPGSSLRWQTGYVSWMENRTTENDHTARITLCGESHLCIPV